MNVSRNRSRFFTMLTMVVFTILTLLVTSSHAQAQNTLTFTGSFDDSNSCMRTVTSWWPVTVIQFSVPEDGTYTLTVDSHTIPGIGFYGHVVRGSYDPLIDIYNQDLLFDFLMLGSPGNTTAFYTAGTTYFLVGINMQIFGTQNGCLNRSSTSSGSFVVTSDIPTQSIDAPDAYVFTDFNDGRLNYMDAAAPIVVYPNESSDGQGLAIYDAYNEDTLLLYVSPQEIASTDDTRVAILIVSNLNGRVSVYRLPDGSIQINAPTNNGKRYELIFDTIGTRVPYTSYELE